MHVVAAAKSSTKTIMRFGSGDQKYAISRWSHVADYVVRLLRNTEKYRYGPAYFARYTVITNQLIDVVRRFHGDEWPFVNADVSSFLEIEGQLWAKHTENSIDSRDAT